MPPLSLEAVQVAVICVESVEAFIAVGVPGADGRPAAIIRREDEAGLRPTALRAFT